MSLSGRTKCQERIFSNHDNKGASKKGSMPVKKKDLPVTAWPVWDFYGEPGQPKGEETATQANGNSQERRCAGVRGKRPRSPAARQGETGDGRCGRDANRMRFEKKNRGVGENALPTGGRRRLIIGTRMDRGVCRRKNKTAAEP